MLLLNVLLSIPLLLTSPVNEIVVPESVIESIYSISDDMVLSDQELLSDDEASLIALEDDLTVEALNSINDNLLLLIEDYETEISILNAKIDNLVLLLFILVFVPLIVKFTHKLSLRSGD